MPTTWVSSFFSDGSSRPGRKPARQNKVFQNNHLTKGLWDGIKEIVPLYEYECEECGHRFEMLQKVADSPLTACVKCKGKVERLLSSPAIQFKGSGWYITDYARKGQSPSTPSSEKTSEKTSEKASESSSGSTSKTAKSDKHRSESGPAASASSTSKE